jgi:hypothetical protein
MPQNTFDIDSVRQLDEDKQGIMSLSTAGLGYLVFVKAAAVTSLAGAFVAGRQCAFDEIEDNK